jgi:hypothetical protein
MEPFSSEALAYNENAAGTTAKKTTIDHPIIVNL